MAVLHVDAPGGAYPIVIEPGLLAQRERLIRDYGLGGGVAVVTNSTLEPLYGQRLAQMLPQATLVTVPDGETHKTLQTVANLYSTFVTVELDRGGTVLALGGGVVGDMAGFAAATYMRGVRLVQAPTTLLSMVDSSVGGKVGVDLPQGKNLVGAFKQPSLVLMDTGVLQTLPASEWRYGLAEVIKHGLLADVELLEPRLHRVEMAETLVPRAVQVKIDLVQADPYENGVRAFLNLGHTFAHAVERVTNFGWTHGAAVGFGLVAAARLSHRLSISDKTLPAFVEELIARTGLPTRMNGLDPAALWTAMRTDKKWRDGRAHFVLLRDVGQPVLADDVPKADVIGVLEGLR